MDQAVDADRLRRLIERQRMSAAVDDRQSLVDRRQFGDKLAVRHDSSKSFGRTPEFAMQSCRIGREFAFRADLKSSGEARSLKRGLGRRAQDDGAAVIARKLVKRGDARSQDMERNRLGFVENDDGVDQIMQFAAARGSV